MISSVNSWNDFKKFLDSKTKQEKGDAFEELTKYYLLYKERYSSKLKNVWLYNEVPPSILKKLNLPTKDQGIDLVAETREGEYWAIQCKYHQDEKKTLSHRSISTFISLSRGIAENITYCLVFTTVDDHAKLYKGVKNIGFCLSDEFNALGKAFFDWLRKKLSGKEIPSKPYKPLPHQKTALKEAQRYFLKEKNKRGKLVFPCGAGKSLTGYWIMKEFKAKHTIVAVPSLSLVKQTLDVYLRESVANKDKVEWLCVCSDEGIGKNDDIAVHTQEIGIPCVTDKATITNWLKKYQNKKTIVFTTYQSGKVIAECSKKAGIKYDLGIMDEAHKTVGQKDKLFSHLLFDKNISIDRRIFMTATERRYAGSSDTILSMDDEEMYGETFSSLSFKKAIEDGILSDYKIITLFIDDSEVKELIEKNAFVKPTGKDWNEETEARTLASLVALRKAMKQYPIKHAVSFHSSIKKSEAFQGSQELFSEAFPKYGKIASYHVSGAMPTALRSRIVNEFAEKKKAIITNARCLTEGIDVPKIDAVLFADPKNSKIDIVQAVGRALRISKDKEYGYVIIPVFTKSIKKENIIESEEFSELLTTLRALASNDERIIEEFRDISQGKKISPKNQLVYFEGNKNNNILVPDVINEKYLINNLQLAVWNKLAKLSWRPFEDSKKYVHSLNLKNANHWRELSKSGKLPEDISSNPNRTYINSGWISWGDWLGTKSIARNKIPYRSFYQARKYVKSLKLKNSKDWLQYCKSGKKPKDIPANPQITFINSGWKGWGDWLGTGNIANYYKKYKSFKEAKKYAISLKLQNQKEWFYLLKLDKIPKNIPTNPQRSYKYSGWKGWGDWLGNGIIATSKRKYLSFEKARNYVHSLKLNGNKEWREFCKSGKKPDNIPSAPNNTYKNLGWNGFGDWLGTGITATFFREYKTFEEARKYVNSLCLKSQGEWRTLSKSGKIPKDIPSNPHRTYKDKGWKNWGDWLGKK